MKTVTRAACLGCDWTDTGKAPGLAAEKHTKATGHATHVTTTPYPDPPTA